MWTSCILNFNKLNKHACTFVASYIYASIYIYCIIYQYIVLCIVLYIKVQCIIKWLLKNLFQYFFNFFKLHKLVYVLKNKLAYVSECVSKNHQETLFINNFCSKLLFRTLHTLSIFRSFTSEVFGTNHFIKWGMIL